MKIVNREAFLALPPNTVYSKYEPCAFEGLAIKLESTDFNDFYTTMNFNGAVDAHNGGEKFEFLHRSEHEGSSVPMEFDSYIRDGCYDDGLFAVWEPRDIQALIDRLQKCLDAHSGA